MMAYLNVAEHSTGLFDNPFPPARTMAGQSSVITQREWAIVWLARKDGLNSIREEGRFGRFIRMIFGVERKNPLSDTRLEALRRMAVLSWRHGYNVAPSEIAAFLEAGFSEAQYETLLTRIRAESQIVRGKMA